jgi:hypothetical protein
VTAILSGPALSLLSAADEDRTAGPLALLVISLLGIAVYFLGRSMAKHLRRVPPSFDRPTDADQAKQPGPPGPDDSPGEEPPPR